MKLNSKIKKISALILLCALFTTGCSKKSNEEQESLTEERIKEITSQNDLFTDMRLESEFEWYNEFIYPLKEAGWNVSEKEIDSILESINRKRDTLNSINTEEIKTYLEFKYSELTKEQQDEVLKKEMENDANNLDKNIDGMNKILDIIEEDVKMGSDGKLDSDEISHIEKSFDEIMKIYETEVE